MRTSFTAISTALFTTTALANDRILFKQAFSPQHGWLHYGMVILILLIITLILAKKSRPNTKLFDDCRLIEKKHLGNKTIVYILDYQQQRFLLADNQQALTIHPLVSPAVTNTTPDPRVRSEVTHAPK